MVAQWWSGLGKPERVYVIIRDYQVRERLLVDDGVYWRDLPRGWTYEDERVYRSEFDAFSAALFRAKRRQKQLGQIIRELQSHVTALRKWRRAHPKGKVVPIDDIEQARIKRAIAIAQQIRQVGGDDLSREDLEAALQELCGADERLQDIARRAYDDSVGGFLQ